jgi:predicted RNA-binding Zn-ribbon protein involved in translation (DUF1610 family)
LEEKIMMKMQRKLIFIIIVVLSILVLCSSLYDIYYDGEWVQVILTLYAILLIITILLLFIKPSKKNTKNQGLVMEFEKTLEGKLQHFKCPNCQGIFALKKSQANNKNPFSLTCPDCGTVGRISSSPRMIFEEIPNQKSENIKFKCRSCGERISLWAEGSKLYQDTQIFSCPYCGKKQTMKSI